MNSESTQYSRMGVPREMHSVRSPSRKNAHQTAPRPMWASQHNHQVKGFHPPSVQYSSPRVDNVTASSEHAFAAREKKTRTRLRLPLHPNADARDPYPVQYAAPALGSHAGGRSPWPTPVQPPSAPPIGRPVVQTRSLRSSRSVGEGMRARPTAFAWPEKPSTNPPPHLPYARSVRPSVATTDDVRRSFRSGLTSNSSFMTPTSTTTDRSSVTGHSSRSDFVFVSSSRRVSAASEADLSVDDVLGLYVDGFGSAKHSLDGTTPPSMDGSHRRPAPEHQTPCSSSPLASVVPKPTPTMGAHRRSQSARTLTRAHTVPRPTLTIPIEPSIMTRSSTEIFAAPIHESLWTHSSQEHHGAPAVPRDRYGFKKASHYISVQQYDAWDALYSVHLERRRRKWDALMDSYGLAVEGAFRFPPKSDKVKRYVRKGIPPQLRGAAWFWYAGGPAKMKEHPGLYHSLLDQIEHGRLSANDREHIERDLNRTFPDNVRFKPDPTTTGDAQAEAGGGDGHNRLEPEAEQPIVQSLRRVLQAFAIHNPTIGYCQSLNFIAGLLLLFLDDDEEKAFTLLTIVTSEHLPGTHGVALEGANVDIAVLMSCLRDSLPAIWTRLDDQPPAAAASVADALRLPTVSLATTAWFMSLFVGTLPIEPVLRVWDCLFFEGSKTLFRTALAIFKLAQPALLALADPIEVFQLVQSVPRSLLDANALMHIALRRRAGFAHVTQQLVERRRADRRRLVAEGVHAALLHEGAGWMRRLRARTRF